MRDISNVSSPDVAEDLAAQARLPRLPAADDPLRCRNNRGPQAAQHFRDLLRAGVDAAAGARNPLEPRDDRLSLRVVFQTDAQERPAFFLDAAVRGDVALLGEDL